jgi:localization factor PodJL
MSVGEWLNDTIYQRTDDPPDGGVRSAPHGSSARADHRPAQYGGDLFEHDDPIADIHHRLDAISGQVARLAGNAGRTAEPSLSHQLSDAISRLDRQLAQIAGNRPQPYERMADGGRPSIVPGMAPGMGRPTRSTGPQDDLGLAIAEISARQNELRGALAAPAAAMGQGFPGQGFSGQGHPGQPLQRPQAAPAPSSRTNAPQPDLSGLEKQIQHLTHQFEAMRRPGLIEESITAFRAELAEIRQSMNEAMPRRAIESLEGEIRALAHRIDESRQNGMDPGALGGIERSLVEIREALHTLTPAEHLRGLDTTIHGLSDKIDTIVRSTQDPHALQQIENALNALRGMVANVASTDTIAQLGSHLHGLAERIDRLTQDDASQTQLFSALEQRIAVLTDALQTRERPAASDTRELENAVHALAARIDGLQVEREGSDAFEALERRIAELLARMDADADRFVQFDRVTQHLADTLHHLESARADFTASAGAMPSQPVSTDGLVDVLKREMTDLRFSQSETERRTQDTLEVVNNTLGHMVDRLVTLEDDLRQARLVPGMRDAQPLPEISSAPYSPGTDGYAPHGLAAGHSPPLWQREDEAGSAMFGDPPPLLPNPAASAEWGSAPDAAQSPVHPHEPAEMPWTQAASSAERVAADIPFVPQEPAPAPAPHVFSQSSVEPAPMAIAAEEPAWVPAHESPPGGMNDAVHPPVREEAARPFATKETATSAEIIDALDASVPSHTAETPAPRSPARVRPPSEPITPIDPELPPDTPLEPGTRFKPRVTQRVTDRIAASEAVLNEVGSPAQAEPTSKLNFIAAARRAAQAAAAASTAEQPARPKFRHESEPSPEQSSFTAKLRSLLVGVSVVVIVLGTYRMATTLIWGNDPAPPAASSSSNPALTPDNAPASAKIAPQSAIVQPPVEPQIATVAEPSSPTEREPRNAVQPPALTTFGEPAPAFPAPKSRGADDVTGSLAAPSAPAPAAKTAHNNQPAPDAGETINVKLPDGLGGPNLRAAAQKGDPGAMFEVAQRYAEGRGIAADPEQAVQWFERAARKGVVMAMFRLGSHYEKGIGVKKDLDAAKRYYLGAAERGNAKAMHNLAVLYADGGARSPDYRTAVQWFRKAAEHGVSDSQYNIGVLYARGIGVDQNLAESYKWFSLAAAQGDGESALKRDDVAKRLDAQSMTAAKLAAQTFIPQPQPVDATTAAAPAGGWDNGVAAAPAGKKPAPSKRAKLP